MPLPARAGDRPARLLACVLLPAAAALAGCSSGSSTPVVTGGATVSAASTTARFTGAYSGTLTPTVCRDTVVDLLATTASGKGAGSIDNAFPADPASTRYRITLYNLGGAGTVFTQAPGDPRYVLSSTDRGTFFLNGVVLLSNTSPQRRITVSGTVACT